VQQSLGNHVSELFRLCWTEWAYREILASDPAHPAALRGLEALFRSGPREVDGATAEALASHLEQMAQALPGDPRLAAWLHVERAALLDRLQRVDAARASLEAALDLDPGIGPVREAYTRHLVGPSRVRGVFPARFAWKPRWSRTGPRGARLEYAAARLASEKLDDSAGAIDLYRRVLARADAGEETNPRCAAASSFASTRFAARSARGRGTPPGARFREGARTGKLTSIVKAAEAFDGLRPARGRRTACGRGARRAIRMTFPRATPGSRPLETETARGARSLWTAEASRLTVPPLEPTR